VISAACSSGVSRHTHRNVVKAWAGGGIRFAKMRPLRDLLRDYWHRRVMQVVRREPSADMKLVDKRTAELGGAGRPQAASVIVVKSW
jgi:hypothetical protein